MSMLWHRQAIFEQKGDKLSSSADSRIRSMVSRTISPADWKPADKPTELSMTKLKTTFNSNGLVLSHGINGNVRHQDTRIYDIDYI